MSGRLLAIFAAFSFSIPIENIQAAELDTQLDGSIKVVLAVSASQTDNLFVDGAMLAMEQINAKGGVLEHPLSMVIEHPPKIKDRQQVEDRLTADIGRAHAKTIIEKYKPTFVIGHTPASASIAASALYQKANTLFISSNNTDDSLTQHAFDLTFRMNISNETISKGLAEYARKNGLCKIIQVWPSSTYGLETSLRFSEMAGNNGIETLLSASYQENKKEFKELLLYLLDNSIFEFDSVDAIFLVANPSDAGRFIKVARELGIHVPIMGNNHLSRHSTKQVAGDAFRNVTVYSLFDVTENPEKWESFAADFKARFDIEPSEQAALAFDAIHVVADAITKTKSLEAEDLSTTLRALPFTGPYQGVTGPISFDFKGNLKARAFNIITFEKDDHVRIERYSPPAVGSADPISTTQCSNISPATKVKDGSYIQPSRQKAVHSFLSAIEGKK